MDKILELLNSISNDLSSSHATIGSEIVSFSEKLGKNFSLVSLIKDEVKKIKDEVQGNIQTASAILDATNKEIADKKANLDLYVKNKQDKADQLDIDITTKSKFSTDLDLKITKSSSAINGINEQRKVASDEYTTILGNLAKVESEISEKNKLNKDLEDRNTILMKENGELTETKDSLTTQIVAKQGLSASLETKITQA
jgi:DNA repair exonuclease SbcCD ATPase subunit